MEKKKIEGASFADTGYSYTLSLISGKYKPVILYCLMEYDPSKSRVFPDRTGPLPHESAGSVMYLGK